MLPKILLTMAAFAANSLLCRLALKGMHMDAVSFSALRLISGAVALLLFLRLPGIPKKPEFNGLNAALLALYVFAFSLAYLSLTTAAGALLLFGTVQCVMTGWGLMRGERLTWLKSVGMLGAMAGLALLLLPGAGHPSGGAALLMMISGAAWAAYCITGKKVQNAAAATAGNFTLAVPMALVALVLSGVPIHADAAGLLLAITSGALMSGGAYLLWYSILPRLSPTTASTLQLSVPCLAALGGLILMGETLDTRMLVAIALTLSGIGLVIAADRRGRGFTP
ncbi:MULTISPECIES: DMT family transporter [unclassified Klebsiella]|uniref:DMT family transporter n=1 Tax=Enterobacteriaceae TaxID=543 RepID=UPI0015DC843E|nr:MULTISPECIES: DMT family transporter [unclassified Klebsiella]HAT3952122.1 DMT family transporter [Kluyvera ascorbata]BBR57859.1 transporter [Klebsiella sp. WP4-W18-ESBL-05]BBS92890.1 transporter [Klebsiella sp. WP7-S18-CRE-02]BBS97919.1 transporter [Klebsiella sp. WP7-S18-CRE-03]BBT02986.1 transporter [Klebsiella sp. WP7-S18-ESBL-04]